MKKFILILIVSIGINFYVSAQSVGDYRSIANGNWNDATKWEIYNASNWVTATRYPGQDPGTGAVNISAFHEIKITASVAHPIASLWVQYYFDEYWTYEQYFGTLTFSAESAISLTVTGNIYAPGIINVNEQAGSKSHTLFIGGSFNGSIEAINADDKLSVIFNSTTSNTTIEANGAFQDVTLNGNTFTVYGMTINGNLTFMNGAVTISDEGGWHPGRVHFKKGATWSGASNTLYVDGWVSKEGDEPFTFPIGQNGVYAPLTISAPVGVMEIFAAKYKRASGADPGGITDPGLFNVSQCEYWELTPWGGQYIKDYPLSITIGWNSFSNCGTSPYITNVADVTLAHSNGSLWDNHGGTATGTISNGSVTWSGVTTFGRFTFGNVGTCKTPSGITATNITGNSATIGWSSEPGAASYNVYYRDTYWPMAEWINAASATTSTSLNLSGLNQASLYEYRVRANCSSGFSSYRQSYFTTLTVCNPPTGLTTTNITDVSATLSWAPVQGAPSYHVEYSRYGNEWIPVNSIINTTSYILDGLSPSTYYYWRVRTNCPGSYSLYSQPELFNTYNIYCNDVYEPNNSSNQAKTIGLGVTISAAISSYTDEDWFKITTPNTSNTTLQVMLSNLPADYDLYIYDKRLTLVGSSTTFGNSNESVILNSVTRKAAYYIKVVGKYGAYTLSYCYDLLVQTSSSGGSITRTTEPANEIIDRSKVQMLYPNPASEFIYLHFKSDTEGMTDLQILNSIGQLVKQYHVNTIKGQNQIKIQTADIRPGMYILRINKGELNLTRKFVIAR
jgi:hypothetical protein